MSKFLEVYIDTEIVTEQLDLSYVKESVGDVMKSVKERLLKWFTWIKNKIMSFFSRIREFITKIAVMVIKQIKRLFAKCKEIAAKFKDSEEESTKESWSKEEQEEAINKDLLTTRMPSKVANDAGFRSLNFNDFFMHYVNQFFEGFREIAIKNDRKGYDEMYRYMDRQLNVKNNYLRIEVLGSNAVVHTDIFTDTGCEKMLNTAKEVCNQVIDKAKAKFDDGIRKLEAAIKSASDVTKEHSDLVQKCINRMSEISTFVRDYIMNNIYMSYVYCVNMGANKLARYQMEKVGVKAANQLTEYTKKSWSLKSMLSSLFKSAPKQSPVPEMA